MSILRLKSRQNLRTATQLHSMHKVLASESAARVLDSLSTQLEVTKSVFMSLLARGGGI